MGCVIGAKLKLVSTIILLAMFVFVLIRLIFISTATPFPLSVVTSESMNPTLSEGDIVVWTVSDIKEIEKGDLIVFKSYINWPDEKLIVHRVTDVRVGTRGEILLETKGDANKYIDQFRINIREPYVREDHFIGQVATIDKQPLKIPYVGYVGIWINQLLNTRLLPSYVSSVYLSLISLALIIVIMVIFTSGFYEKSKKKIFVHI